MLEEGWGKRLITRFVQEGMPPVPRDEAQTEIASAMYRYVLTRDPEHMLVIQAPPGVGKTHLAIALMGLPYLARKRILFAGPRRDFFDTDIIPMTIKTGQNPDNWLNWQPRQLEDEAKGRCETCAHAPHIQIWNGRGHNSFDYCRQICGIPFMKNGCAYYDQEHTNKLWIYGAPEHVFGGHLLKFHLVIGDESPIRAALRKWEIPGQAVIPGGYDPFDRSPAHEMLAALQNLVVSYPDILQGQELLEALGGADLVREAAGSLSLGSTITPPHIRFPEEGSEAPYAHVLPLMMLLKREAEEALQGNDYLSRVIVEHGKLMLLLRRLPDKDMPKHMIWLDATANERIYKEIFGREVEIVAPRIARQGKIFQVADNPSAKSSLVTMEGEFTVNVERTKKLIAHIIKEHGYKTVGVITFAAIEEEFKKEGYQTMHFGAETGSNLFEGIDVLFVIGTPMPPQHDIEGMTKIIYFNRMRPFQKKRADDDKLWSKEEKRYEGHIGKEGFLVGGYGGDLDLQSVLWQHREAKLIQAVHRARINLFSVDVWLLSRLPIRELPPDEVKTLTEIWGGPKRGIEASKWLVFKAFADEKFEKGQALSTVDVAQALGVTTTTARRWISLLVEQEPDSWQWPPADYAVPKRGRGKPALQLIPKFSVGENE